MARFTIWFAQGIVLLRSASAAAGSFIGFLASWKHFFFSGGQVGWASVNGRRNGSDASLLELKLN